MLCFSYGSNMSKSRLEKRIGTFKRCGAACLTGYTLRFHKKSKDGSGKCDAFHTGNPDDAVWGALDRLTNEQFFRLDNIEVGYRRLSREVTFGEQVIDAHLYLAKKEFIDSDLEPFDCYKELVVEGARELNFPSGYIDTIEVVSSIPNPCRS